VSSAIAASTDLAGYNVLAVDDNEINRMVLVSLLEHEGARVDCTNSGAATLARLQQVGTEHYDIILTDIQMPGMDGYELTRRIHEQHPALPILGLTAHADEETRARCLAAGMLAHIPKPISLDLLITEVCRHSRRPSTPRTGSATMPATAPSPETTTPAGMVDWSALETQFRGKASFVTRLADKALINYRTNAIRLRALAAGQGELSELSFVAHSIKGTAGTLKATAVYELAAATDQAAREGSPDSRSLAAELADQLDELTLELEARVRG
jgi:CheY-like chemotaxis protein